MKTPQIAKLSPHLRRLEQNFVALVDTLFRTCPDLLSFSLGEQGVPLYDRDSAGDAEGVFVTDIMFTKPLSLIYQEEICDSLSKLVLDVVSERSEAIAVLRGRTFARTLH